MSGKRQLQEIKLSG